MKFRKRGFVTTERERDDVIIILVGLSAVEIGLSAVEIS